jgi:hypothetical protein
MHRYLEVLIENICDHGLFTKSFLTITRHAAYVTRMATVNVMFAYTALSTSWSPCNTKWEDWSFHQLLWRILYLYWPKSIQNIRRASAVKIKQLHMCLFLLFFPFNQSQSIELEPQEYHGPWLVYYTTGSPADKWMLPLQHSPVLAGGNESQDFIQWCTLHTRHSKALLLVSCVHQDQNINKPDQS